MRIAQGTRSGLWLTIAEGIRVLRPRLIVLENVAALRSRGLGRVLGDLAALGYDANWTSLRASDVGAAHRRDRVFLLACRPEGRELLRVAADAEHGRHEVGPASEQTASWRTPVEDGGPACRTPPQGLRVTHLLPTPRARDASGARVKRTSGGMALNDVVVLLADQQLQLLPTPRASEGTKGSPNQRGSRGDLTLTSLVIQLWLATHTQLPQVSSTGSSTNRRSDAGST